MYILYTSLICLTKLKRFLVVWESYHGFLGIHRPGPSKKNTRQKRYPLFETKVIIVYNYSNYGILWGYFSLVNNYGKT